VSFKRQGGERKGGKKEEEERRRTLTLFSRILKCSQGSIVPQSRREREWEVFDKVFTIMETEVEDDAD